MRSTLAGRFTKYTARTRVRTSLIAAVMATALAVPYATGMWDPTASAEYSNIPDDTWQVVTHIPDSTGLDVLVWDFAEGDGVVYVAGSFAEVREGGGQATTPQPYLAAFDIDTGDWVSSFRPTLDGTVYTVEVAANGSRVYAGGEFTGGITAMNPTTGVVDSSFDATVDGGGLPLVQDIELSGSDLYIGGDFSRLTDTAGTHAAGRLARLSATGQMRLAWHPNATGGGRVWSLAVSKTQAWVHIAGRFEALNGSTDAGYFGTVGLGNGDLIAGTKQGLPDRVPNSEGVIAQKLYAVVATNTQVWLGGEPHVLAALDPNTLATEQFFYTNRDVDDGSSGGDIQAIGAGATRVYAGCHCWGSVEGFDPLDRTWDYREWVDWFGSESRAPVRGAFAVDQATQEHIPAMTPDLTGYDGAWAVFEDSTGNVWWGGQFSQAAGIYPGGFVRLSDDGTPATDVPLIDRGSNWNYHWSATPPANGWNDHGFDAASWPEGAAEFGYGDNDEATRLNPNDWSRALYARREFTVSNADQATALVANVKADDGYALYLNGTEVASENLPGGALAHDTPASSAWWGDDERRYRRVVLDPSLMVDGTNVFAVEVRNAAGSNDLSMDVSLSSNGVTVAEPPAMAPQRPGPIFVEYAGDTWGIRIGWARNLADDLAGRHEVRRDGEVIATVNNTLYRDTTAVPGETYTYDVIAIGPDGARSEPSNAVVATTADRPARRTTLRANSAAWQIWADAAPPSAGWEQPGYDDAGWSAGAGIVGFGENNLGTEVAPVNSTYLRGDFTVANPGLYDMVEMLVYRDDAAIVYINGHEISRENLAVAPTDGNLQPYGPLWGNTEQLQVLLVPSDLLVAGNNTIAVLSRNSPGSSDSRFGVTMLGRSVPLDDSAPGQPGGVGAEIVGGGVTLAWEEPADDEGVTGYTILRNGNPVGISIAPGFHDPAPGAGVHQYRIVATDPSGARSTPSAALNVNMGTEPVEPTELVGAESTWQVRSDATAPPAQWNQPGFNPAGWASGSGHFGYGDGDETTVLPTGILVHQLRHNFTVDDPAAFAELQLDLIRDDGAVVYLNGAEVVRSNMPAGPIDHNTYAASGVWGADERDPEAITIPVSALVPGENVIAVGVHNIGRNGGDLSIQATLTGLPG